MANVNFDLEQLQTLLAVIDAGSFEDASIDLGISPSAVSQRIKALESRAGAVLLVRSRPVTATEQGHRILGYARQITMLGRELGAELQGDVHSSGRVAITVGVNADSLATWFAPVFTELAQRRDLSCEFIRADEHQSSRLLKEGKASGVVTTRAEALQGCTSQHLGTMRYRAVAADPLVSGNGQGALDARMLSALPVVNFDREDPLQQDLLEQVTGTRRWDDVPVHYVPDSWQFAAAIEAGMGWGMLPEVQLRRLTGVRVLHPAWMIEVPLYWQRWSVASSALDDLGRMLLAASCDAGLRTL